MIPRIIMYSVISCSIIIAATWAATHDTNARRKTHTVLTRIVPTEIDGQPVYPTNHAIIPLDPTQEYQWESITLPTDWPKQQYYIELWGKDNRPIAGFTARRLDSHSIDIAEIDATLTPALRVVIFQPAGVAALPLSSAVYISYHEYPNVRLFVLLAAAALIYWTIFTWSLSQWSQLRHLPKAISHLLHGRSVPSLLAVQITVLGSGIFGAVLGMFIGGIQIMYILIKLPFLMGSALIISFTALAILGLLLGIKKSFKELWSTALNLLAVTALGLASLTPLLGFYIIYPLNHDHLLIATIGFFVAAGLLALTVLYRWVKHPFVPLVWLVVYGLVFMQMGWLLRPWVGVIDPIHETVPLARANSGNVFVELGRTLERLDSSPP